MKYNAHVYFAVRVRIDDIEAESQADAAKIADDRLSALRPDVIFDCARTEDDESAPLGVLIDEQGDEEYERTRYHELDGARLYLQSGVDLIATVKLARALRRQLGKAYRELVNQGLEVRSPEMTAIRNTIKQAKGTK